MSGPQDGDAVDVDGRVYIWDATGQRWLESCSVEEWYARLRAKYGENAKFGVLVKGSFCDFKLTHSGTLESFEMTEQSGWTLWSPNQKGS